MRSNWIEYKGKKILFQDFSKLFYNSAAVKAELNEIIKIVTAEPKDSVLVLTDMRDTNVGGDLIPAMNAASTATKDHIHKTAVLGVIGMKRKLADLLTALTGQPLKYFGLSRFWRENPLPQRVTMVHKGCFFLFPS